MNDRCYSSTVAACPQASLLRRVAGALRRHVALLAVLSFAAVYLSPALRSDFYFDDVKNACTKGQAQLFGMSIWHLTECIVRDSMRNGRVFPGALALTFVVHYFFTNATAYKGLLLLLTLANLVEFYYLLRCWKVSRPAAALGTLALVLLIQLRAFADPLLGFAGIMQLLLGQMLLTMVALERYLATGRRSWLAASVAVFTTSLVTYEISYFFVPIFLAMIYARRRDWRASLATLHPYIAVIVVLSAFIFGLRYNVRMPQDFPYRFRLFPVEIVATSLAQATSALPLSYALMSPHRPYYFDGWRAVSRWENWLVAAWAAALAWLLLGRLRAASSRSVSAGLLAVVGLLTWYLPGVPISVSPKYQSCVEVGIGYLPVYVQYVGVALLAVAGLMWLSRQGAAIRRWLTPALAAASAMVALLTFDTSRFVVELLQGCPNVRERHIVEAALAAGLGEMIPAESTVLATTGEGCGVLRAGPPVSSSFMTQHLRRCVHAINGVAGPGERSVQDQLEGLPRPSFVLAANSPDGYSGYVLLGTLDAPADGATTKDDSASADSASAPKYEARDYRIFVRGRPKWAAGPLTAAQAATLQSEQPVRDEARFRLLRSGADWAIYEGRLPQPADAGAVARQTVASHFRQTDAPTLTR